METSGFRSEHHHHQSHVPQQSRRDKLRVQQVINSTPISNHHLDNLSINALDHHHHHQFALHGQDHANLHARNARHSNAFLYDHHGVISSEILDFSRNAGAVLQQQHRSALAYQDLGGGGATTGSDVPQSFMINWSRSLNANAAAQGFDNWPAAMSYSSGNSLALGSCGNEGNDDNDVAASMKPRSGLAQLALANIASSQISGQDVGQKYYLEGMNLATSSSTSSQLNFHSNSDNNILQDQVVTVASTRDMFRSESELALLPFSFANNWTSNTTGTDQLGNFDSDAAKKRDEDHLRATIVNDSNLQGLSLSLSSINSQPTLPSVARLPADQGSSGSGQDLPKPAVKLVHSHSMGSVPKSSIISKACGKSLQDIVGVSSSTYRSTTTGPLGPFTGYATILKSSRFLKPAQQLLDEFCGSKLTSKSSTTSTSCDVNSERLSGEASASISISAYARDHADAMDQRSAHDHQVLMANFKGNQNNHYNNSCASSSTIYGSNEINSSDHGGVGSNISFESGSSRPEQAQQKKAKLLYMQEEVSRRYKQYRQQMQMVVSSFESVAGLSAATPYISLALKAVSRHFRCLRSAIADQLDRTRKALGEDLSSPTTGTSSSKGADAIGVVRLKYMEQSFQKHKPGGATMAFSEPQQHHIWRPQRGLPERSVAVLRAWLFEHFLHPYPTDTDKHMLATQTGLTRNQVSNWFINARVRVWKPMVEEIHTLEMKGSSTDQGSNKHNDNIGDIPAGNDHQASSTKLGSSAVFFNSKQLECSGMGNYNSAGHNRSELFSGADQHEQSQEKRSRLECQAQAPTSNMASAVVQGFVPYHRSGLEVWSRTEQ